MTPGRVTYAYTFLLDSHFSYFSRVLNNIEHTNNLYCFLINLLNNRRLHRVQTGSGEHPASYPMGTGESSPELRRSGRETDHSSPLSAEVKNAWNLPLLTQYVFMVRRIFKPSIRLHGVVFS
jgi:hypothetical protein